MYMYMKSPAEKDHVLLGYNVHQWPHQQHGGKQQTNMLITDCIKAFDKVNHERVLKELNHYGKVDRNFISFISNRRQRQRLILDQAQSGEMEFDLGVPQGSVLGPCLLSSLHVQYAWHWHAKHCVINCPAPADNIMLYAYLTINSQQDTADFQNDLMFTSVL